MTSSLFSERYSDPYYSDSGGLEEKRHIFVEGNKLPARFENSGDFVIAELGFGTGLSFLATLLAWENRANKRNTLTYLGIEHAPLDGKILAEIHSKWHSLSDVSPPFIEWYRNSESAIRKLKNEHCSLELYVFDVIPGLEEIQKNGYLVDAWFFDGFTPSKNQEMWTEEVFRRCKNLSKPSATFSTYSTARIVKDNLSNAGIQWKIVQGYGRKRNALTGTV